MAVVLAGCGSSGPDAAEQARREVKAEVIYDEMTARQVVFDVFGSASSANLTIGVDGSISQQQGVKIPLRSEAGDRGLTFDARSGDVVSISAQDVGGGNVSIGCSIETADGDVIDRVRSSGAYSIASCSGVVP